MPKPNTKKSAILLVSLLIPLSIALLWSFSASTAAKDPAPPQGAVSTDDRYVGSEACKECHEDQFKEYSHTSHARLTTLSSWQGKVTGCETCHGPGKAHIEEADPAKIISFKNKTPKESSETCLSCHAGKDDHNNFRRGEHWRNNVGCIDCHSPHSSPGGRNLATSNTFISPANAEKPDFSTVSMLKLSEPQLCMSCHSETKAQFTKPFHHKVLEGAMRCTDCHNAHGGFELKQARLATGADSACMKCHTDKQGPFVYEHAPVKSEGCASCHTPHGSSNPRLLRTSSVAQLCLECHSQDHGVGAQEPAGPAHNLAAQYRDCTACHVRVHGSYASPVFMR